MNKTAGKLSIMTELYDSGFFCDCKRRGLLVRPDGEPEHYVIHDEDCKGNEKMMELLNANEV